MIEHCISSFENKIKTQAYRNYMTDIGYTLTNLVAVNICGGTENAVKKRFCEIIEPSKEEKVTETKEEVIARIKKKLKG